MPALRTVIAPLIGAMVARTDARLLAYSVMPSHVHIVLRQGRAPLSAVMQPLLHRMANRVQAHHALEGTIFERRYRDRPCVTPDHVRETIMYTHLNPWRAGLCSDDLAYPWMTQAAYGPSGEPDPLGIASHDRDRVLELFALDAPTSVARLCADYARWVQWRMEQDRSRASRNGPTIATEPRPDSYWGDRAWATHFTTTFGRPDDAPQWPLPDLRDFIAARLALIAPGCRPHDLRGTRIPRRFVAVRRRAIKEAATRGYRTGKIARFFGVSPATVSVAKYAPVEPEPAAGIPYPGDS